MNWHCCINFSDVALLLALLLIQLSGDVESNPGPKFPSLPSLPSFEKKDDPILSLQLVVDKQNQEIRNGVDTTSLKTF